MKNSLKIIALLLVFTTVQSCSDLLETSPSTSISQEKTFNTKVGIKALRASMYTELFSFGYNTGYMVAPSSLADGLYLSIGANRFDNKNFNNGNYTVDLWEASYDIIQKANLLINAVPEGVISNKLLKQYRGEAYFMRAFAMHNLARSFSYEPNTIPDQGQGQKFKLGIVIRTEATTSPDQIEFKGRSTIQESYQQIESDLLKAIDLLSQGDAGMPRYGTRAAAEALLARVYLYWEKWQQADKYATAALQHTNARLAKPGEIGSLFYDPSTTIEVIFRAYIADPSNAVFDPLDEGKAGYTSKQYMAQVPTQDLIDLYSKNDARLAWFRPCYDEISSSISQCLATHPAISSNRFGKNEKQGLELGKWDGSLANNYSDHIPYFRVPEMLLIQAEARINGASGNAAKPLNKLRNSRGLDDYTGTITIDTILEARRREFIGEGQRYWDLKRLGRTIRKAPETKGLSPSVNDVPYSSFRILSKIPSSVVAVSQAQAPDSAKIKQNPVY